MGDEIVKSQFSKSDYERFFQHLSDETEALKKLFEQQRFSPNLAMCGLEQEAWIVDKQFRPAPENQFLLQQMQSPLLSPELARFNIELNVTPQLLSGSGLQQIHAELQNLWLQCEQVLSNQSLDMQMIGILPTVEDSDFTLENMSEMNRYRALNEQVLKSRNGSPIRLNIVGMEHLKRMHDDVMLESAATSFQIHRQVPPEQSARYYNAAVFLSPITVAVSANSPLLFEKLLWQETRIPLFEQAVEVGGYGNAAHGPIRRVTFGSGYVKENVLECFQENLAHYPVLLPVDLGKVEKQFAHLRMHNGTIWRWNRPLIGFDDDGIHIRVEHRVVSAGPSLIDEMANAAFFYGLQEYFATQSIAPETLLNFSTVKNNFYSAAQHGLTHSITWFDDKKISIQNLVGQELLEKSRQGLEQLCVNSALIENYLGIIQQRVEKNRTGSRWQQLYVEKHGRDMQQLCAQYWENQQSGIPVHEWNI